MTFQERWAEGPPVGPAELLTPEEAKNGLALWDDYEGTGYQISPEWVKHLCRNYLTLWERNKELEALIPRRLIQRVGGTETGGP